MSRRVLAVVVPTLALVLLPAPAFAYVGPGSVISAVGAVLAVLAGLFFAVFGFIWYPMKRITRALRSRADAPPSDLSPESPPPSG